ncbi:MAG: pitrilysin family protein [Candidatus Methanomethylophilaceae archaeon]|nr:pitrilysin family protein [Candidatus Methanomethylophilaceae archaeon]
MAKGNVTMERTPRGIPVVTDRIEGCRCSGYMIAVNTGSRDESEDIWGLSHLLEHSVFRSTKTRSSFQMSKEIEGAGGELNAFTAKEMTAYHGVTLKETEDVAKSIVADIVCNPLLKQEDIDLEKKIVIQEIGMCENDPSSYIHDLFAETIWRGNELAHNEAGTVKIVEGLTADDLRRYYEDRYTCANLAVFACGDVDPADAMSWAEENLDPMSAGTPNKRTVPEVREGAYRHFVRKEDHCYVGMGFPALSADDPDRTALSMLNAVIGAGSSSRMFQQVREERALVYSVYNYIDQNTDAASMATFFSSTEGNVLEAMEIAGKVYGSILRDGVSKEELDKARNLVKGATIRQMESTEDRLYRLARNTMLTWKPASLEERLAEMDAVTCEDLARAAERVIRNDLLTVTMYGRKVRGMRKFSPAQIEI